MGLKVGPDFGPGVKPRQLIISLLFIICTIANESINRKMEEHQPTVRRRRRPASK